MQRMRVIVNPQSDMGDTRGKNITLKEAVEAEAKQAEEQGRPYQIDWVLTERPLHATELAAEAGTEGFDIVVAVGGDGTVHEVVNGLMQLDKNARPKLGIIPAGSGNDFAHNVGLPVKSAKAIPHLFMDQSRSIDAAHITDSNGRGEYWNNTMGFGFAGAVNLASKQKEKLRGFILYLVSVIETIIFNPQELNLTITVDGQEPFERFISMMSVCNGPREGGGFPVAPQALMDDGLLSYMIMMRASRLQMFYFVPVVMIEKQSAHKNFFEPGVAKKIHFKSDKPLVVHLDGESFCRTEHAVHEIEVSIIPAALDVLVGEAK